MLNDRIVQELRKIVRSEYFKLQNPESNTNSLKRWLTQSNRTLRGYLKEDLVPSENNGQIPSYALVEIWTQQQGQWRPAGFDIRITNRDDNLSISAETLVNIHRIDGEWVVEIGGSGSPLMQFTIIEPDCANGTALVQADYFTCGHTDDLYPHTVYDRTGCNLVGGDLRLVGRKGWASWMDTEYGCEWQIINICCDEDNCP